jgi:hypothetical protein
LRDRDRRSQFKASPGKSKLDHVLKHKVGVPAIQEVESDKIVKLSQSEKQTKAKRAGGVSQVVENFPVEH